MLPDILFALLVNGGIHEIADHGRSRAVDGHGDGGIGIYQVESGVEFFSIIEAGDGYPGVADLSIYIGSRVGIESIEGHRVVRGRQSYKRLSERYIMKAFVGAFGSAFPGEHAGRVFAFPFEGENAGGIGEFARNVFSQVPFQDVAPGLVAWQGDLRDLHAGERFIMGFYPDLLIPYLKNKKFILV